MEAIKVILIILGVLFLLYFIINEIHKNHIDNKKTKLIPNSKSRDYFDERNKVLKVIRSCQTSEHLESARKYVEFFIKKHDLDSLSKFRLKDNLLQRKIILTIYK